MSFKKFYFSEEEDSSIDKVNGGLQPDMIDAFQVFIDQDLDSEMDDMIDDLVNHSYQLIASKLPKKQQEVLKKSSLLL